LGVARLRDLGATIREVSLPHTASAVPAYYVLSPAEAAANLARYDGVRYGVRQIGDGGDIRALYRATRGRGFGAEVQRRILVGTFVLSAGYAEQYYARAQAARRRIQADFLTTFATGVDLLFTPTTPTPAFRAGDKLTDPVQMYLADIFVSPASLAGIPAMSQPLGRSEGLPLGGQLMAPPLGEDTMISVARLLESTIDPVREVR
jgi:aspartyl-tRNA(Asn)/glutamyl-tRNA(Gln) amidotransferase subunit A